MYNHINSVYLQRLKRGGQSFTSQPTVTRNSTSLDPSENFYVNILVVYPVGYRRRLVHRKGKVVFILNGGLQRLKIKRIKVFFIDKELFVSTYRISFGKDFFFFTLSREVKINFLRMRDYYGKDKVLKSSLAKKITKGL